MHQLIHHAEEGPTGTLGTAFTALRVLVAAFFLFMAFKNLSGDEAMAADFRRWGYADSFRVLIGVAQAVGGLVLLVPAVSYLGALLLAGILIGAVATHLIHDPPAASLSPLVFLALVGVLLYGYRPPLLR